MTIIEVAALIWLIIAIIMFFVDKKIMLFYLVIANIWIAVAIIEKILKSIG